MTIVGEVLALIGAAFVLLAAVGLLRFPDTLARMHILSKATSVGFVLIALGAAVTLRTLNDATSVLLAAGLQVLTMPVAANLIGRSTYMARGFARRAGPVDELADARSPRPSDPT